MVAKKPALEIKGQNFAGQNRVLRSIKMAQPIHSDCQWPRSARWWVKCEDAGHNPYITEQIREVSEQVTGPDPDDASVTIVTGTKIKKVVVERPNLVQVPLDMASNDGRGPDRFARDKGFRQLEEVGYEPLCQLHNCWLAATLSCEFGEFCSKEHARLVGAMAEGVALEVLDRRKRRAQLRAVEID